MTAAGWVLRPSDEGFPASLTDLGDRAPGVIHGLGNRDLARELQPDRAVTIVGARRSGAYGRGVAHEIAYGAAAAGLVVVSGMALGCDSAAHEGALAAGGETVAVLGSGPDVPYPRSKAPLHRQILESGGAVIAELPPGTQPRPAFFPQRNRIMAALGGVAVIVEGAHRSGTRHTATEAVDLGRDVAAVPGPVTSTLSELPNDLIRDGATLVRDTQDVLDLGLGIGATAVRSVGPELDDGLDGVLAAVEGGAATCDAVAIATGASGHRAAVGLARLELMGYVVAGAGGRYARTTLKTPGIR
jgi:DNA processing protein